MTNADKIRSMSDEELAKAFAMQCIGRECQKEITCADCWLDWLKQERDQNG